MVISRAFIPPCNLWALEVENSRTRQTTLFKCRIGTLVLYF